MTVHRYRPLLRLILLSTSDATLGSGPPRRRSAPTTTSTAKNAVATLHSSPTFLSTRASRRDDSAMPKIDSSDAGSSSCTARASGGTRKHLGRAAATPYAKARYLGHRDFEAFVDPPREADATQDHESVDSAPFLPPLDDPPPAPARGLDTQELLAQMLKQRPRAASASQHRSGFIQPIDPHTLRRKRGRPSKAAYIEAGMDGTGIYKRIGGVKAEATEMAKRPDRFDVVKRSRNTAEPKASATPPTRASSRAPGKASRTGQAGRASVESKATSTSTPTLRRRRVTKVEETPEKTMPPVPEARERGRLVIRLSVSSSKSTCSLARALLCVLTPVVPAETTVTPPSSPASPDSDASLPSESSPSPVHVPAERVRTPARPVIGHPFLAPPPLSRSHHSPALVPSTSLAFHPPSPSCPLSRLASHRPAAGHTSTGPGNEREMSLPFQVRDDSPAPEDLSEYGFHDQPDASWTSASAHNQRSSFSFADQARYQEDFTHPDLGPPLSHPFVGPASAGTAQAEPSLPSEPLMTGWRSTSTPGGPVLPSPPTAGAGCEVDWDGDEFLKLED